MALTYDESATLMIDPAFRGRVKVACLKFSNYILDEAKDVPAHNTRLRWAQQTIMQPDAAASAVTPPVVMDTAVQDAGMTSGEPPTSAIEDAALQGAVETTVNKML